MIAQCWLHIGTEKTGTTSIQEFLARNRDRLLAQGYLYPVTPGFSNHVGIACYALDDAKLESTRRSCGIVGPAEVMRFRSDLAAGIESEIQRSNASAIIFSNEHLSSRLRTPSEFQSIKSLCDRVAQRTKVIVYLRNQVDFLVSRYIEAVKGGNTNPFLYSSGAQFSRQMDYARLLAPWRDVFGADNLIVRRFEPEDFQGGELVSDFGFQVGFDARILTTVGRFNEALDADCVDFLREFNKYVPHFIDGRRNPLRGRVITFLEQTSTRNKYLIPKATAEAIERHFSGSNDRVSTEYFGSTRHPLFRPSRSVAAIPMEMGGAIDMARNIRIAASLWTAQQRHINEITKRGLSGRDEPGADIIEGKGTEDRKQEAHHFLGRVSRWARSQILKKTGKTQRMIRTRPDE